MNGTWKKWRRRFGFSLLLVIAVNVLAVVHAWRFLNYSPQKTAIVPGEKATLRDRVVHSFLGIRFQRPAAGERIQKSFKGAERWLVLSEDQENTRALELQPHGRRGTVILIPGMGMSQDRFYAEATWFHRLGFTVILHDTRGNGASGVHSTSMGLAEWQDVGAVLRRLSERHVPEPYILYGQGTGAIAALRASEETELVSGLLLDGLPGTVCDWVMDAGSYYTVFPQGFFHLVNFHMRWMNDWAPEELNVAKSLEACELPLLLLRGGRDPFCASNAYAGVNLQGLKPEDYQVFSPISGYGPSLIDALDVAKPALRRFFKRVQLESSPTQQ